MRVAQRILCPVLVGVALSASLSAMPGAQTSIGEQETIARIQNALHISVKNLRTTLVGIVDTELDKVLASTRARTVPGVLNVDVDVMVARDLARK